MGVGADLRWRNRGLATCWRSEVSRDVLRRPPRPRFPPSSLPSSPPPPHVLHNIQRTSPLRLRVPRFELTNRISAAQTLTAHRRGDSGPTAPGRHGCSHRPRVRNHPHGVRQHSGGSAHASGAARRARVKGCVSFMFHDGLGNLEILGGRWRVLDASPQPFPSLVSVAEKTRRNL